MCDSHVTRQAAHRQQSAQYMVEFASGKVTKSYTCVAESPLIAHCSIAHACVVSIIVTYDHIHCTPHCS